MDNWYKTSSKTSSQVSLRIESVGSHHGQADMIMIASIGDTVAGTLEFSVFSEEPYVNMIKVNDPYKRQGIATTMLKELQKLFPGTEIHMGMSTEDGSKLLESIPTQFIPNKRHKELSSELNVLQVRLDELQTFLDTADPNTQRPEMLAKGEEWNKVHDRLYDVKEELRYLKPGRTLLV